MWQAVITGLIVAAAFIYTVLKLYRYFSDPLRKCRGCHSECGGCALETLKSEVEKKVRESKLKDKGTGPGTEGTGEAN